MVTSEQYLVKVIRILQDEFTQWLPDWRDLHNLALAFPILKPVIKEECGPFKGKLIVNFKEEEEEEVYNNIDDYKTNLPPARTLCISEDLGSKYISRSLVLLAIKYIDEGKLVVPGGQVTLKLCKAFVEGRVKSFNEFIRRIAPRVTHLDLSYVNSLVFVGDLRVLLFHFKSLGSLTICAADNQIESLAYVPAPKLVRSIELSLEITDTNFVAIFANELLRFECLTELDFILFNENYQKANRLMKIFDVLFHGHKKLNNIKIIKIRKEIPFYQHMAIPSYNWKIHRLLVCTGLEELLIELDSTPKIIFGVKSNNLKRLKLSNPARPSDLLDVFKVSTCLHTLELSLDTHWWQSMQPKIFFPALADAMKAMEAKEFLPREKNGDRFKMKLTLDVAVLQLAKNRPNKMAVQCLMDFLFDVIPCQPIRLDLTLQSTGESDLTQVNKQMIDSLLEALAEHAHCLNLLTVSERIWTYLSSPDSLFGSYEPMRHAMIGSYGVVGVERDSGSVIYEKLVSH